MKPTQRAMMTICVTLLVLVLALSIRGRGRRDIVQYGVLGATGSAGCDWIIGLESGTGQLTLAYLRIDNTPFPARPPGGWHVASHYVRGPASLPGVLGFNLWGRSFAPTPFLGPTTSVGMSVPYWAIAVVLSALTVVPGRSAWQAAVRRRRARAGQCLGCGYDVRATPGQCPECGGALPPPHGEAAAA